MASYLSKVPGFAQKEKTEAPKEDEQSLTTILATHEDRTNFLLLVAGCTEFMRKAVADTFEAADVESLLAAGSTSTPTSQPKNEADPEDSLILQHGDEDAAPEDPEKNAKSALEEADAAEKKAKTAADAEEAAKKEHLRLVKEVQSKDMTELKSAALAHFDDWNSRILERVGEAVNQKDQTKPVQQAASHEVNKKKPASTTSSKSQTQTSTNAPTDDEANTALRTLYPPLQTPFVSLPEGQRVLILHSLLLLTLSLEHYSSHSRVLLLHILSSLRLPVSHLTQDESKVAQGLLEAAKAQMNADEETKKKAEENAAGRKWKVGLGAVAGAAIIGVTGGLAAPFLAAGIGTVMGGIGLGATATATYLGALAGSAPLVGALFGAYGGRMAGQMVDNYAKEVSDFAFIPIRSPTSSSHPHLPHRHNTHDTKTTSPDSANSADRRLRVAIGISGWLNSTDDVVKPWHVIGSTGVEAFALRWELEALLSLGSAISTYVKSAAWGVAKHQIIQHTVFAALSAGLWPLGILKVAQVVDNPFSVARSRSEKAGRVLADALMNKVQGERPVTLIGYSLGARVIFSCCEELARRRAFGLVESVVLAGAAVPGDTVNWRRIRSVVAGRVVNVYSTQDYLLGFLYRTSSLQYGIAGLQAVNGVHGVENVDVTDIVNGHMQYRFLTGKVLKKIGFEDVDEAAVEAEERRLVKEEERTQAEQQKKKRGEEGKAGGEKDDQAQIKEMEDEVEMNKKAGMMGWMNEKVSMMGLSGGGGGGSGGEGGKQPEAHMSEEEKLKSAHKGL